jgi:hypothetical protein
LYSIALHCHGVLGLLGKWVLAGRASIGIRPSACCIASDWVPRRERYPQYEFIRRLTTHRYAMWLSVSREISTRTPLACPMVILDTHMAAVTSIRAASYDGPALHHLPCLVQPSGPCGCATAHSTSATKQRYPPSRYGEHDVKDLHRRSNWLQRLSGTQHPALRKSLQLELHHSLRSTQRSVVAHSWCQGYGFGDNRVNAHDRRRTGNFIASATR